jgi:hypothetical protein
MTIKLFAAGNQQHRTANNAKGWIFGWTSSHASTHARDTRDPKQQAPSFGMYGALIGGNGR